MGASGRRARLLVAALLLVAASGCKWFEISVTIPDFDSRRVEGVWVWKEDPATGTWQRAGQIVFEPPAPNTPSDELHYIVVQPDGFGLPLRTRLARARLASDEVTLRLWYARFLDPGRYRVSTYNAAGESALSPEVLELL
ncbi:hypothetical protein MYXO_01324 [Myxococcaceae bacterium]|jgi:hypothetical protein|nr:hypothetical protein MYXO_01324 [Myxococcaceae bacterium]